MSNTEIWDALKVTDPASTKAFRRGGGFSGTAIKPMWVIQRLTEQFGPCGVGWGVYEPSFQLVPAGNELMVYCTVMAWHGDHKNTLYGVGGDKVLAQFSSGLKSDDEAFKKAFTDAIMNAFKFIGVGADVHMGLFDDSKYVQEAAEAHRPAKTKQEDTHGPDWPNLVSPSSITSNAAKKDEKLVQASRDVKAKLDFAPTLADLNRLIEEVTPIVATFPETWRRVLWGEYAAVKAELEAAE